jgi:hypothetical protein
MASRALKIDSKKSDSSRRNASESVNENDIATLAYQLWQERGCPIGAGQEDWFRAEQVLRLQTLDSNGE